MSIFEPILARLNAEGGRYVIVGGLAVVLHGHPRLTVDLDLVVDLAPDAARRTLAGLLALGFRPLAPVDAYEFADAAKRRIWTEQKGMRVFSLYDPENPLRTVDLFVDSPIQFEELWSRSELVQLRSVKVHVASLPDLIRMKRLAGRDQDLEDVLKLEEILRLKGQANRE